MALRSSRLRPRRRKLRDLSGRCGSRGRSEVSRPPVGLWARVGPSGASCTLLYDFRPDEDDTLARGLRWNDWADKLVAEADALEGRERLARLKAATDARA